MLHLILPALIPSWRFFKSVQPSPRIEWAVLDGDLAPGPWLALNARPDALSPLTFLKRLFWNPAWNDALFMVSCAERLIAQPTDHSVAEIQARVRTVAKDPNQTLQFRVLFVDRVEGVMRSDIAFISAPFGGALDAI